MRSTERLRGEIRRALWRRLPAHHRLSGGPRRRLLLPFTAFEVLRSIGCSFRAIIANALRQSQARESGAKLQARGQTIRQRARWGWGGRKCSPARHTWHGFSARGAWVWAVRGMGGGTDGTRGTRGGSIAADWADFADWSGGRTTTANGQGTTKTRRHKAAAAPPEWRTAGTPKGQRSGRAAQGQRAGGRGKPPPNRACGRRGLKLPKERRDPTPWPPPRARRGGMGRRRAGIPE